MYEFVFQDIGEGLVEAEVLKWLVSPGDLLVEDQPFVEIETDKAVVEMPAPASGTVVSLGADEGDVIKIGDVLIVIDDGKRNETEEADEPSTSSAADRAEPQPQPQPQPVAGDTATTLVRRPVATPATRALARELGVDLNLVQGSGPAGRIVDADVTTAATERDAPSAASVSAGESAAGAVEESTDAPEAAPAPAGLPDRIPLRGVRKRTAETMTEAWTSVPHVDSFHEVDVTDLFRLRRELKPMAAARGVSLTLTAFFAKATALALVDHPILNSTIDLDVGEIVVHPNRDIGVAVDTPDGLVLPILRHVDERPVMEIARELERLGELARSRRLPAADMSGGTFTISNHGVFGGWFGTSLVHGSEVGIVGFGPAQKRAVFDDEDRVVPRQILVLNAAADHRVVDGRDIIAFCSTLRKHIESPLGLLLEGS